MLQYSLSVTIPGTFGQFSSKFSSALSTLNDYQVLTGSYEISPEEFHIDRTNGNAIEEVSIGELELAALREDPDCVLLIGRKDLISGSLFDLSMDD